MDGKSIKLLDYINYVHSDDDYRKLFINMDKTLKYLHENGYYVISFQPIDICLLNNTNNEIKYEKIVKENSLADLEKFKEKNIYMLSFLQVGIYSKTLDKLTPDMLRDNFDAIASFVPVSDVAYYRGVLLRNSHIYFSDYENQRASKEIENYSDLNGENGNSIGGKRHVLSNGHNLLNNAVNDKIYNIKNSVNGENAFISVLLFPTVLLFLIIIFIIINILCVIL